MSYDGIRLAKAPKDPKAALKSCIRHTELPLGSLATVLIPSPLHYSYLTPIYPPPSSPRQIQYVPPSVSIWCHTDILSDLLICLFTLSCLSHTHCLTEEKKNNHPHPLSSRKLQEMIQKLDNFLAPWVSKSDGSGKRTKDDRR